MSDDPSILKGDGSLCRGGEDWVRFLSRVGRGTPAEEAFIARNFLLDEGILDSRVDSYREAGAVGAHASVRVWEGLHESYLATRVSRQPAGDGFPSFLDPSDELSCPESFRFIDSGSPFLASDLRRHLIRVERLEFIANRGRSSPAEVKSWAEAVVDSKDTQAMRYLENVLETWERDVEARPVYAAFLDDLEEAIGVDSKGPPGWADTLRDSLGLFHYDPGARGPIDVLVFRYPVSAVPRLSRGDRDRRPLLAPTVLDGRWSPAFLPAPKGSLTGHVVDLAGDAKTPRREVVHPSIAFRAQHLWRVGTIVRPVEPDNLPEARGLHLGLVRQGSGRDDYARGTDGDLS